MRWKNTRKSTNIEDRRRQQSSMGGRGGGSPLGLLPLLFKGKFGIVLFIIIVGASYFGIDLGSFITGGPTTAYQTQINREPTQEEEQMAEFTASALALTEDFWQDQFQHYDASYKEPTLVLYTQQTSTACGFGQAAMGPFYCPSDQKVYIDLSFYKQMKQSLGGGGDFAQGYVVAHEVGHHVQNLLGIGDQVRQAQQSKSKKVQNQLSVRQELQADCFAGMWGKYVDEEGLLETGDIKKALDTAAAIGDDRLQKQSQGRVVPDSFTHGSSEQRQEWFMRGYKADDMKACDTFSSLD